MLESIDLRILSLITVTTKTVNDANIEEMEEYLNIKATAIQVNINSKLNWIDNANNIPRYVATPLPPLNFNQIGKTCPKKANRDDNWISSGKYCIVIDTGIKPFKISNISVVRAKNLLPVLRTFVAPIFPDPIFLISFLKKILVNNKPKGIDPLR